MTSEQKARKRAYMTAYYREARKNDPERYRAYSRVANAARRANDRRIPMLANAKVRARQQGVPFDLTIDDLIIPTHCPVFGMELRHNDKDASPSLDKIVPTLGYVKGNIEVISRRANRIKNDATPQELATLAAYYAR